MRRLIVPISSAIMLVALFMNACSPGSTTPATTPAPTPVPVPAPAPAPTPASTSAEEPSQPEIPVEYQTLIDQGLVEARLAYNPCAGVAVKPDGTPYRIAVAYVHLAAPVVKAGQAYMESLLARAGAAYFMNDGEFNPEKQTSYLDQLASLKNVDGLMISVTQEAQMVPAVDRVVAAGIPVVAWDLRVKSDKVVSLIHDDLSGPMGSYQLGAYMTQVAKAENKKLNVYEVWTSRNLETIQDRDAGFKKAAAESNGLVEVVLESPDTMATLDLAAQFVQDAFTSHPELNAMFCTNGEGSGAIQGLAQIDRLKLIGDPEHVVIANNDCDEITVEQMRKGNIDAFTTHEWFPMIDMTFKTMINHLVLGKEVPSLVPLPVGLITPDNLYTKHQWGASMVYPLYPTDREDLWPTLDTTELGITTPTRAERMQLQGY